MFLHSILAKEERKKKKAKNFVHVHEYVFALPFIAMVDLPVLYKAVS